MATTSTTPPTTTEVTTSNSPASNPPPSSNAFDGVLVPSGSGTTSPTDTNTTTNDAATQPSDTDAAQQLATSGEQVRAVSDQAGNLLVAWLASDGAAHRIYGRRYIVGSGWQATQIIDDSTQDLRAFSLSMAANGDAILGWVQSDGQSQRATVRLFVSGAWQASRYISTFARTDPGDVNNIKVAIDASGAAMAVWLQGPYAGSPPNVYASRYETGGGWQTPVFVGGPWGSNPDVAMDGRGNAAVAWLNEGVSDADMHARYYTQGSGWQAIAHLHMASVSAQHPSVAISPDGSALAVWTQAPDVARVNTDLFASRYVPANGWSEPLRIELNDTQSSSDASIAMDASGNAAVVWRQNDGVRNNIYATQFRTGAWTTPTVLENSEADAVAPVIAMSGSGQAVIAWEQLDNGAQSIWYTRSNGSGWLAPQTAEAQAVTAGAPRIAMYADKAALAWQQTNGVWVRRER